MNIYIIIANVISIIHYLIIIFVLFAPFCNQIMILLLHIVFCIGLLFHWFCNSDVCCLSVTESYIRGIDYRETFLHRIISPVYNINEERIALLCKIIVSILCIISIMRLYNSNNFTRLLSYIYNHGIFNPNIDPSMTFL